MALSKDELDLFINETKRDNLKMLELWSLLQKQTISALEHTNETLFLAAYVDKVESNKFRELLEHFKQDDLTFFNRIFRRIRQLEADNAELTVKYYKLMYKQQIK